MGCCYCEGCYLTPKQRKQENPRLTIHVKCFLELVRTESEMKAMIQYLKSSPKNDTLLRETLGRIEKFWKLQEKAEAMRRELQLTIVTETMTENKKKTQQEIELEQQEAEYHMMQEAEKRQAEAEAEEEQRIKDEEAQAEQEAYLAQEEPENYYSDAEYED